MTSTPGLTATHQLDLARFGNSTTRVSRPTTAGTVHFWYFRAASSYDDGMARTVRNVGPHDGSALTAQRSWTLRAGRELVIPDAGSSIRWSQHDYPAAVSRLNYHPEYELHHIRKSSGRFIVGDQVGSFGPGQVMLVGPDVAHDWVSYLDDGESVIHGRDGVLQFRHEIVDAIVSALPELFPVTTILHRFRTGVVFTGLLRERVASLHLEMECQEALERAVTFVRLLTMIAAAPDSELTPIETFRVEVGESSGRRSSVDAGFDHIFENLDRVVRLSDAARRAQMSESAFSKQFKRASGRTFSEMLTQVRVSHACRLLESADLPVSEVALRVGYANLSNFNRQFKRQVGATPREYRKAQRSG